MDTMKTIAIFSGYYVPHLGGVERYTDNLSKELVKRGYNVIIVASNYNFIRDNIAPNSNPQVFLLPVYKLFVKRYPIIRKNAAYRNIIHILENKKIDAIIVNTRFHLTSLVGAKFGKKNNIPVFLVEHGSQHLTIDNKILDYFGAHYEHALTSYIKRYVDYYYGVSEEASNWLRHFGIVSNGVWHNSINDFSNEYSVEKCKDKTIFLYAGRILKQKGIIELINSFNKLNKKYDDIELRIAGDGNLLPKLVDEVQNENIVFLGKLDFDSLCKEYSKANIFVYAPIWPEGLPTGLLEAGLLKCACIASPQGGIKEIITNNENGLMVTDENELFCAMEKMLNDKDLSKCLGENLCKTIKEEFIWNKTAETISSEIERKLKDY